jgi:putative transcriptional regulator
MSGMSPDFAATDLTNHFLIAMPGLNDDLFGQSVVFLCEHSPRGALGLVINKPSDITLNDLFDKVELPLRRTDLQGVPVFLGGPLQTERGFVLHEALGQASTLGEDHTPQAVAAALREAMEQASESLRDATAAPGSEAYADAEADTQTMSGGAGSVYAATLAIPGGLEMTTSRDVLEAMAAGAGPRRVFVTLGYASWGEGQLESEIGENSWLTVPADPALIFETPVAQRYERAMALLGVSPGMLAPGSGHA